MSPLTIEDFEAQVHEAVQDHLDNARVRTFADAHLMTDERGLVIRVREGDVEHEFQVTITRSGGPSTHDE